MKLLLSPTKKITSHSIKGELSERKLLLHLCQDEKEKKTVFFFKDTRKRGERAVLLCLKERTKQGLSEKRGNNVRKGKVEHHDVNFVIFFCFCWGLFFC